MATYIGSEGDDTYSGTAGDDTIIGNGGNDSLWGNGGNDSIIAGSGNDYIDGGDGNDTLISGDGNDILYGWTGNDMFIGQGSGADTMYGESGDDGFDLNTIADLSGWLVNGGAGTDTADLISGDLQLGTTLPFAEIEQLDTLGTVFRGTAGADSYNFSAITTVAFGTGHALVLAAGDGNDTVTGTNTVYTGGFHQIFGEGGDDVLIAGQYRHYLSGDAGNDSLVGGIGSNADTLDGGDGNDTLNGTQGNDSVLGGAGDDLVYAVIGTDKADGGDGTDTLNTTSWVGAYLVDLTTGLTQFAGESFTNFENLISGIGSDTLTGTDGANRIDGNDGNDTVHGAGGDDTLLGGVGLDSLSGDAGADSLDGGAGIDTMAGGDGDDMYLVDAADVVTEASGTVAGTADTVFSTLAAYTLATNVENLVLMSSGAAGSGNDSANQITGEGAANLLNGSYGDDTLLGLAGNDTLLGEGGDDTLDGGIGADSMSGGDGGDLYIVDNSDDLVFESYADTVGGLDRVRSSVSYALTGTLAEQRGFGIEELELTGSADLDASGNTLDNLLIGNTGANRLVGADGNDTLQGGDGDDTLDGGIAADVLQGGAGDDVYRVDNVGDTSAEASDGLAGGNDLVLASATHTLGLGIESLTLLGSASLGGTGNALDNLLGGNTGANRLDGGSGADTLLGGAGNDTLIGGSGIDMLVGGAGNDVYVVTDSTELIVETSTLATEIDTVQSSLTRALGANLERLTLTGSAAINGSGNTLANLITGNAAANILNGGTGNDTLGGAAGNDSLIGGTGNDSLVGGTGNDIYVVDASGDLTVETSTLATEIDTVQSSVTRTLGANLERLTLTGSAAINGSGNTLANLMTGNTAANALSGGSGNDTLNGGAGLDTLNGGAGLDSFLFNTVPNSSSNADTIVGFSVADDRFLLENSIFTGLGSTTGTLGAAAFRAGTAAADASDRIVYDAATGRVWYDADGSGTTSAVLVATVSSGLVLTLADFVIV